jgi:hypothetical protein
VQVRRTNAGMDGHMHTYAMKEPRDAPANKSLYNPGPFPPIQERFI